MNKVIAAHAWIVLLATLLGGCHSTCRKHFKDFDDFSFSREYDAWILAGSFGPDGPFKVVNEKRTDYGAEAYFTVNRNSHMYPAKKGSRYLIVRLENEKGEHSFAVFRSKPGRALPEDQEK